MTLQKQYGEGKKIHNAFQTNGILLNDEWCQFLHDNGWLVGISLDGPAELHDAYRVNRSGKPTHHKVVDAIARLRKHQVEFNLLVVVNSLNSQRPGQMYRYLRQLGTPFCSSFRWLNMMKTVSLPPNPSRLRRGEPS